MMTMVEIGRELSEDWSESSGSRPGLRFEGASSDNEQKSELKESSLRSSYPWAAISGIRKKCRSRLHALSPNFNCLSDRTMSLYSGQLNLIVGHRSFMYEQLCVLACFCKDLRRLSIT